MTCDEVRELAAAYALRALEPDEQRDVEAHLDECDLHEDLAGLRAAALAISVTAPEREPPAGARERLLARAGGDAQALVLAAAEPRSLLRRLGLRAAPPLPVALAALVVALGVWVAVLLGGDDDSIAVVREISAETIEARLVYVPDDQTATLAIGGLAQLGATEGYQLWVIRDGTPIDVGLFEAAADGTAGARFQLDLRDGDVIAVTIEPSGGSPQPTSDPLFTTTI